MKYTPAQERAVFYGDGNLLLSAAAGSGKTAALTGRISELLIEDRAELSEMLIVTYTRAAAAEMRSRISRRLRELSAEGHRVGRHLAALPSADISTIHSFLYKSLRPYFPTLGLSPDYRVADVSTIRAMKTAAMRDVVDDFFSHNEGISRIDGHSHNESGKKGIVSFAELADVIGQARDSAALDEELLRIAESLVAAAEDESALDRYADDLDEAADGILNSRHGAILRGRLEELTKHYFKIFSECADEFPTYPKVNDKYGPVLHYTIEWLERVHQSLSTVTYDNLRAIFASYAPPRLGTLPAKDACEASDRFKFHRERLKKDIEHFSEAFFPFTEDEIRTAAHRTAAVLRCAKNVIGAYFRELERRKRTASALEYSDLETLAIKLFLHPDGTPTNAAREVGSRYKYVFIDEYQDTNRVQDRIFRAISESSVRFMVGDIKQSIYRFRGAEPEVFAEYRRAWNVIDPAAEEKSAPDFAPDEGHSLFMSENFRCDSPVVRFVNMVSDYTLPHGGIPYDDGDALIHAKTEPAADPVEVCLIECPRKRTGDEDEEPSYTRKTNPEAVYIARRIRDMIGKYSPDGTSVLRASDIAILLRSPSPRSAISAAADYESALAEYGIPVKMKTARPVTSYASVQFLMCLLNVVDNPLRDVPAAGAMRSPVFGFTVADLVMLRRVSSVSSDSDMPLYMACEAVAKNENLIDNIEALDDTTEFSPKEPPVITPELRKKCADFLDWVSRHKTASRGMPSDRYIEFLIHDVRLFAVDGIRGNPTERDAVNRFCLLARTYEGSGEAGPSRFGGISGFLAYLADTDGTNEESTVPADTDAVSIMSIHTSKGLEFPVCFLAECSKRRNTADERGSVLIDRELGLGMYLPDEGGLVRCGNFIRCAIAEKMRGEAVAEEMRMLYVALTRARNRLIVTAKVPNAEKLMEESEQTRDCADGYFVTGQGTYIQWIIGAAAKVGNADFYHITQIPETSLLTEETAAEAPLPAENPAVSAGSEENFIDETALRKRFSFAYPHEYLAAIPSKLSVSGLYPEILDEGRIADTVYAITETGFTPVTEAVTDEETSVKEEPAEPVKGLRPRFMTGDSDVKAADRGSATHIFLQFADFTGLAEHGAEYELDRLVKTRHLSAKLADMVNMNQLKRFVRSDLMDKIRRSPMVRREFRFNTRMPAEQFTADEVFREKLHAEGVKITVQGVVDCVFRDPDSGRLVLVDYKTDSLSAEEWQDRARACKKLTDRHRNQLLYYRGICGKMFGEEIAETLIYSTVLGECIAVE
ncbi:MAG: UvrD-helicase domain-containing protein [Clostridia bacterium]|nr:UvrD-helicase domain-containing protein [Clostridia bacterium]